MTARCCLSKVSACKESLCRF